MSEFTKEQKEMIKEDFSGRFKFEVDKEKAQITVDSGIQKAILMKNVKFEKKEKINFLDQDCIDTWGMVKGFTINRLKENPEELKFFSHCQDEIRGKPQKVHPTLQKIPLIRETVKKDKQGEEVIKYKFIDDRYDKRYDGYQKRILSIDFWLYRILDNGKEYYIFSQEELPNENTVFKGMKIELEDISELSKSMKVRSISTIFILHEHFSSVQILEKENLIEVTKHLKEKMNFGYDEFHDLVFSHDDGNIYDYSKDFDDLKISQLLSGKYEGYPLHLLLVGAAGTGKTQNQECIQSLFNEEQGILEGGSSTPKVLEPSFKEKPANIGYIAKCNRVAMIDELFKMVQNQMARHDISINNNHLGSLNFLLEHKKRMVGSGNDNSVIVQATAKIMITTNPLGRKDDIYKHYGIIDPTTLSRMAIWVQDEEEHEKVRSKKGIRVSPNTIARVRDVVGRGMIRIRIVLGGIDKYIEIDPFLTIYDSCQVFRCDMDLDKIKEIIGKVGNLAKEPFRNDVFRPRALHHAVLILDGITKYRCLFKDYDKSFKSNEEDYKRLDEILMHMVRGWDTSLIAKSYGGTIN